MDVFEYIVSIIGGVVASVLADIIIFKFSKNRIPVAILILIVGAYITSAAYSSVTVQVPTLNGMSKDQATQILDGTGLKSDFEEQYNDTVMRGVIISQDTPAGIIVKKGTKIHFIVSNGSFFGSITPTPTPTYTPTSISMQTTTPTPTPTPTPIPTSTPTPSEVTPTPTPNPTSTPTPTLCYSDNEPAITNNGIKLINISATCEPNPPSVNSRITIEFTLQNVGNEPITFEFTFIAARNPSGGNKDIGYGENAGRTIQPQEIIKNKGSIIVDSKGTWQFGPAYSLKLPNGTTEGNPNGWRRFQILVE